MKKFITYNAIFLAAIFLSVVFVASASAKVDKAALIENMIKAYGGAANLKKLDSYTSMWSMEVKTRQMNGKAVVFVEQTGKLRVELVYPESSETRVIAGSTGYKGYNKDAMQEVTGPKLTSMKLQMMRLYTPLTLKAKQASITEVVDTGLYKAIIMKEGTLTVIYYVNAKTFLIDAVIGKMKMGPREMEFRTEYTDFKLVGGVMMHHTENKFAAGMNTALLTLKQIKLGEKHPDSLFKK
jgi:hypothetical protein